MNGARTFVLYPEGIPEDVRRLARFSIPADPVRARYMQARTIDYTRRDMDHDYTIRQVLDRGKTLQVAGWGERPRRGDILRLQGPGGIGTLTYEVAEIDYTSPPRGTVWLATLTRQAA